MAATSLPATDIAKWVAAVNAQKQADIAKWVAEVHHQQDVTRWEQAVHDQQVRDWVAATNRNAAIKQGTTPAGGFPVPPKQSSPAATQQAEMERQIAEQRARADAGLATSRLTTQYQTQIAPQLQGSLGANGQFYGTAGKNAQGQASNQFLNSTFDINSALQRKLDDFTRQRTYASLGLII